MDISDPEIKRWMAGLRLVGKYHSQFIVDRKRTIRKHPVCWARKICSPGTISPEEIDGTNEVEMRQSLSSDGPSPPSKDVLMTRVIDRDGKSPINESGRTGHEDIESRFARVNSLRNGWWFI